jgi:uncharacterized protein YraI
MVPVRKLLFAAGLLGLTAGAASAFPAMVQNDLNLRSGPGTGHGVVAVMPAGSSVNVFGCQAGWCEVAFGGQTGFASQRYLGTGDAAYAGPRVTYVEPRYRGAYAYEPRYRSYRYGRRGYDAYAYAPHPLGHPIFPWNW